MGLATTDFDPDAYLAQKTADSGFDPDAYLKSKIGQDWQPRSLIAQGKMPPQSPTEGLGFLGTLKNLGMQLPFAVQHGVGQIEKNIPWLLDPITPANSPLDKINQAVGAAGQNDIDQSNRWLQSLDLTNQGALPELGQAVARGAGEMLPAMAIPMGELALPAKMAIQSAAVSEPGNMIQSAATGALGGKLLGPIAKMPGGPGTLLPRITASGLAGAGMGLAQQAMEGQTSPQMTPRLAGSVIQSILMAPGGDPNAGQAAQPPEPSLGSSKDWPTMAAKPVDMSKWADPNAPIKLPGSGPAPLPQIPDMSGAVTLPEPSAVDLTGAPLSGVPSQQSMMLPRAAQQDSGAVKLPEGDNTPPDPNTIQLPTDWQADGRLIEQPSAPIPQFGPPSAPSADPSVIKFPPPQGIHIPGVNDLPLAVQPGDGQMVPVSPAGQIPRANAISIPDLNGPTIKLPTLEGDNAPPPLPKVVFKPAAPAGVSTLPAAVRPPRLDVPQPETPEAVPPQFRGQGLTEDELAATARMGPSGTEQALFGPAYVPDTPASKAAQDLFGPDQPPPPKVIFKPKEATDNAQRIPQAGQLYADGGEPGPQPDEQPAPQSGGEGIRGGGRVGGAAPESAVGIAGREGTGNAPPQGGEGNGIQGPEAGSAAQPPETGSDAAAPGEGGDGKQTLGLNPEGQVELALGIPRSTLASFGSLLKKAFVPEEESAPANDKANGAWQEFKDSLSRAAQAAYPAMTRLAPDASAAASKLGSAPIMGDFQVKEWGANLKRISKEAKMPFDQFNKLVGSVITEGQLRGVREKHLYAEDYAKAQKVKSAIGAPDSPFKTERDYEKALKNPAVKSAVDYIKQNIEPVLTDNYKASKRWNVKDANGNPVEPPARDPELDMHMSLAVPEDVIKKVRALRQGGNVRNTMEKHSPLEWEASGAAPAYELGLDKILQNAISKGTTPALHAQFYKALVDSGHAIEGAPNEAHEFDGKPAVAFDLKFGKKVFLKPDSEPFTVSQNRKLYVDPRIAPEVRSALNVDLPAEKLAPRILNTVQLAGLTDATSHLVNNGVQLVQKRIGGGVLPELAGKVSPKLGKAVQTAENLPILKIGGIADAVGTNIVRRVMGSPEMMGRMKDLAGLGALQGSERPVAPANIVGHVGRAVRVVTDAMRLALADGYDQMVKDGLVPDSAVNKRDWVNQAGNYARGSQAALVRLSRDTGFAPFATAGTAGQATAIRNLAGFAPGIETNGALANARLRIGAMAQVASILAVPAIVNYLRTGGANVPGVPHGALYLSTGKDGKPVYWDLAAEVTGARRAERLIGAFNAIEGMREGSSKTAIVNRAGTQALSAAISPAMGPLPSFLFEAATGHNPHGMYKMAPDTDFGKTLPNLRESVLSANSLLSPVLGSMGAIRPEASGTGMGILEQLGKLAPRKGLAPADLAKIQKAAMNDQRAQMRSGQTGVLAPLFARPTPSLPPVRALPKKPPTPPRSR